MRQQVSDTQRGLVRARPRLEGLDAEDGASLRADIDQLITELVAFVVAMPPLEPGE